MRGWMLGLMVLAGQWTVAAENPAGRDGDFVLKNFHFRSGETLPEVRIHYHAWGTPGKDNAVLIVHGTGGSGASLIRPEFSGELFGPGQLLDASRYFIVLPDALGHGKSSKPSDGLHAKFPKYGYNDMVEAEYRLLTEGFGVKHARLIMGTSMGCMHTWLFAEQHTDFMDALMPLACLPTAM
jgi:homoserine O-acetyltransferase